MDECSAGISQNYEFDKGIAKRVWADFEIKT